MIWLKAFWLGLLATLLAGTLCAAPAEPQLLSLHSLHSMENDGGQEAGWPPLRVGIVLDEYIPYYVLKDKQQLEGVTADYLSILGRSLRRSIVVAAFTDKDTALQALHSQRVEALAGNLSDADQYTLPSHPYFANRLVEVKRKDEAYAAQPLVAIGRHPFLARNIPKLYANSRVQSFDNALQALQAVAFNQADLFIGNPTEANFLINQLALDRLEIANYATLEDDPFVFLLNRDQRRLLAALNQAIARIPSHSDTAIQQRWRGGAEHYNIQRQLKLSRTEAAWIRAYPEVRFAAPSDLYPLVFRTGPDAPASGMAIDLLKKVGQLTGLRFVEAKRSGSHDLVDFSQQQVDVIPNLAISDARRETMIFSAPYVQSLWGVITRRDDDSIKSLADLAGKRVAVIQHSVAANSVNDPALRQRIEFVETPDLLTSFRLLEQKKVDANINNLLSANAIIRSGELGKFKIVGTANQTPLSIAIATNRQLPVLAEIINKAVLAIPQEELDQLRSEWMNNKTSAMHAGLSRFNNRHYQTLIAILASCLLLLLAAAAYRGRQIQQQQKALRSQLDTLGRLVDQLPFALFIKLPSRGIELSNPLYRDMHASVSDGSLDALQRQLITHTRADQDSTHLEGQVCSNGQQQDLLLWAKPFATVTRDQGAVLGGWFDISAQKRGERALLQAKNDAESANRAKTTFLAIISHEIRTPMNAILGLLELELNKAPNANLSAIAQSATSLLHLLDGILDQAKIEAGQLSIAPHPASTERLLAGLAAMYGPIAKENGLSLQFVTAPDLPVSLLLDEKRVSQVLGNVLGNAIKFTEHGYIRVETQWQGQPDGAGALHIAVSDSGRGISAEAQARIFDAYSQEQPSGQAGTGLGLWICANLIKQMDGEISLSSQPGQGTCVSLHIPSRRVAVPAEADSAPVLAKVDPLLRVLVVDDHPANRLLLEQQLRFIGIGDVSCLASAEEALTLLQRQHCDVLISDCFMPGTDGFALARQVRQLLQAQPFIVAYTADARASSLQQALDAGMDCCLIKPVNIEQLAQVLSSCHAAQPEAPLRQQTIAATIEQLGFAAAARRQFIQLMLESNRQDGQALQPALDASDFAQLAKLAHKLLGAARIIQDQETMALCELLQDTLDGGELDACRQIVADLALALAECAAMLQAIDAGQ